MAQVDVERALGRLLTDEAFRLRFRERPEQTAFETGLKLSACELSVLAGIDSRLFERFSAGLDERIRRLAILDQDESARDGGQAGDRSTG